MSKVRVPIANTPAKVVTIESDATIGATFGVDLRYPDGTLVKASDFSAPPTNGGGTQPVVTIWRLILEIPPNVTALANTITTGLYVVTNTVTGTSETREITVLPDELTVADGAGIAGDPLLGLADVAPTAGGALQKYGFDAKGRRSEEEAATTDDLAEGATNLYFTGERAQDAVGAILQGVGGDVELHYADGTPLIFGTLSPAVLADLALAETALQPGDNVSELVNDAGYVDAADAQSAVVAATITNGDTTHAPSGDAVFDALATKADTASLGTAAFEDTGTATGTIPIFDGSTPAWGNPALVMEAAGGAGRVGVTGIAGETDADAQAVFVFNAIGSASVSGSAEKRLGIFFFNTSGATAGNRGGLFGINLKQNGATTLNTRLAIQPDGPVRPGSDNTQSLGTASFRWSVVFAGTGTINTSDAREKTIRGPLTETELAAAQELASAGVIYQWNDAIELKGDDARWHFGPTVQSVIEVMERHGLDPFRYAFVCYDQWDELPEVWNEWPAQDAVLGEDGNVIQEAVEAGRELVQEYRPAGDRYSLRPDQLLMFIARGQEERLARLEVRFNS